MTSTTLGLLAATLLWTDPVAVSLLAVPTVVAVLGYRSYVSTKERRSRLDSLYESARVLHEAMRSESALIALLSQSREMFKAEVIEMTVFVAEDEDVARRTTVGPGDQVEITQIVVHEPAEPAAAAGRGKGGAADRPWRRASARDGGRDVIVAPLRGENGSVGTLLVGNRLGDVGAFDAEDLRMLNTLGNHIGISIENVRLQGLREAVTQLTEANRLKDDFLGMVSHELRTPITVIRGAAGTLLDPDHALTGPDRRSLLESIDRSGTRLGRLVEDLLAQARIEARRETIQLDEMGASEAIGRVVEELASSRRGHELQVQVPAGLPPMKSDVNVFHHILRNLLENAFKYAREGSTITVAGMLHDGRVVISVEDEGPGIPGPLQQKIFVRYFQVDDSNRRRSGGVGLGLYISRQMAEMVGGRLWLERSDEDGSVFRLSVPAARDEPSPRPRAQVAVPAARG